VALSSATSLHPSPTSGIATSLSYESISTNYIFSTIRQVPDNQEVYLDKDGFTSIIFDITERVGPPGSTDATDGAALTIHLEEIVDSDVDTLQVWSTTRTEFTKLPYASLL
jgi:hypothetical protein